jgi:hypothetical protein
LSTTEDAVVLKDKGVPEISLATDVVGVGIGVGVGVGVGDAGVGEIGVGVGVGTAIGDGTGVASTGEKTAVTLIGSFMVTVQAPAPKQSPAQLLNV